MSEFSGEHEDDLRFLSEYPSCAFCLTRYVKWLFRQPSSIQKDNDLLHAISTKNTQGLELLEKQLLLVQLTLGKSLTEMSRTFGFGSDLLAADPEKIHVVLAELWLVLILDKLGFTNIEKLPRFIKSGSNRLPIADFIAETKQTKCVIELKTIQRENSPKPEPGKIMGNSMKASWWRIMFRNNIRTKIEDKNRHAIKQLVNSLHHYNAGSTILAVFNRRMGPITLMNSHDFQEELRSIVAEYNEIDHILLFDSYNFDDGNPAVIEPPLD